MTTTTELDELDLLSNPVEVAKAELENNRPRNLPKFVDIVCDIANDEMRKYEATGDFGEYEAINLRLTNIVVNRCVEGEIFTDDEYNLEIRVPKKANSNSPITLMVAAAMKVDPSLNSIRKFPGLKKVHLVEQVHTWAMREKAKDEFGEDLKELDKDGKERQVYTERKIPTRYYAVVGVGSKGAAVKAAPVKVTVTDEAKAVAKTLIESEADGMTDAEFNKAAMKNPVLKDMTDILMDGSLIAEVIATGEVIRDGEKLRVTKP